MKYITTIIALLVFNSSFSQLKKITSYNLGQLYEQVKYTDYNSFKGNCGGYVNNVRFESVFDFFDDENRNNNTLKEQVKNNSFRNEYQQYIDKIIKNGKQISFYSEPNNNCPLKKFNYFKNILTSYEVVSKYYFELDNIETERLNAKTEFYNKVKRANDSIIESKKLENKNKANLLVAKSDEILEKEGVKQKQQFYNNGISSLNSKLETLKKNYEKEQEAKIKKLSPTNFRANKLKIDNEYNSKINSATSKNELDKKLLEANYKNSTKAFDDKYNSTFEKLQKEYDELNNFDYNSLIQEKVVFDDSKFMEQQNELKNEFDLKWKTINENLTKIYNEEQNSGNRVNVIESKNDNNSTNEPKKESSGKKALKVGGGILLNLLKK